jgi:MraZ protein
MNAQDKGMYVGTFRHTLDGKNRLTIPAKWRFAGDEGDTSYLALPNPNGSITVYPPRTRVTLEAKLDQISTLADADEVNTLQQLFGVADYFGCDAQGRICLSDKLRRYAGLEKDAVLVGMYSVFNIWSPALCPVSDEITPGKLNFNADVLRKYKL